jgi:hypothetical protein
VECCYTHLQWQCEVAENWRELEHAIVHVDAEHTKHAQWVTCLVSLQAMEELGHFQVFRNYEHICASTFALLAVWCFRLGFCTALCDIS